MGHYYNTDNHLKSETKIIKYTFANTNLQFFSDNGVFSKDRVDYGTNILLNNLPNLTEAKSILDIGCGIGVVGICLAKKYPASKVDMTDVNERAISLAKKNIHMNELANANSYYSFLYENIVANYDVIISNPPIRAGKTVVYGIIEQGYSHLNDTGQLIVVVQKKQGAESLMRKMDEVYQNVEILVKQDGYYVFKSIKNKW